MHRFVNLKTGKLRDQEGKGTTTDTTRNIWERVSTFYNKLKGRVDLMHK